VAEENLKIVEPLQSADRLMAKSVKWCAEYSKIWVMKNRRKVANACGLVF
jgi:hypothetical protein